MNERELRVLRTLANEVRALQQEIQAARVDRQTSKDSDNDEIVQPLRAEVTVTPQLDPAHREYYDAENRDRNSFGRKFKPWVETIGVLVAVALAVFNLLVLRQIQQQTPQITKAATAAGQQTELFRRQMEGTMAAILYMAISINYSRCCDLQIVLSNGGGVIANKVTASVTETIEKLPTKTPTGPARTFIIPSQPLKPSNPNTGGGQIVSDFSIPELTTDTRDSFARLDRTMRVEITMSYENGFGTLVTQSECWRYLVENFRAGNPDHNAILGPSSFGFRECNDFDERLIESLKSKRLAEEDYQKQIEERAKKRLGQPVTPAPR